MLILARKQRESVVVGETGDSEPLLKITVLEVRGNRVKLGFEASDGVVIHREEMWERIHGGAPVPSGAREPALAAGMAASAGETHGENDAWRLSSGRGRSRPH